MPFIKKKIKSKQNTWRLLFFSHLEKKNPEIQRQRHLYFYMTSLKNIQQNKQKTCARTHTKQYPSTLTASCSSDLTFKLKTFFASWHESTRKRSIHQIWICKVSPHRNLCIRFFFSIIKKEDKKATWSLWWHKSLLAACLGGNNARAHTQTQ